MNVKVTLLAALLLAGAGGAVYHATADPSPLRELLVVPASFSDPGYLDIETIVPGAPLASACEPGRTTVLAFVSDSCPGCTKLLSYVRLLCKRRPDVAIRFVDVGRRWSGQDCRRRYGVNVRTVPHVLVYSRNGKLLAADDGRDKAGRDLLYDWMNAELRRTDQDRYASAR